MNHKIVFGVFSCFLVLPHVGRSDEIDELVSTVNPPARFADYTPDFSVDSQDVTFQWADGPRTEKIHVIKDGDRCAAYVRMQGSAYNDGIYLLSYDPADAPESINYPEGRFHHDTELGPQLGISHLYADNQAMPSSAESEFSGGGETITLTRTLNGQINKFTLSVDPVLGYVVDADCTVRSSVSKVRTKAVGLAGGFPVWPDDLYYRFTVYTPSSGGYTGYYNNGAVLNKQNNDRNMQFRDAGFVGFLDNEDGWGYAISLTCGAPTQKVNMCGPHNSYHIFVDVPSDRKVRQRLAGIPPEIVDYLEENMNLKYQGTSIGVLPIGVVADFENQPISIDTFMPGLWDSRFSISPEGKGYEGGKCLMLTGTASPITPNLLLKHVGSPYKLEAMMKVEGSGSAHISAVTKEWSSVRNADNRFTYYYSDTATAGEGWKEIAIEMDAETFDPFLSLIFHVENATAYIDNFSLTPTDSTSIRGQSFGANVQTGAAMIRLDKGRLTISGLNSAGTISVYDLKGNLVVQREWTGKAVPGEPLNLAPQTYLSTFEPIAERKGKTITGLLHVLR